MSDRYVPNGRPLTPHEREILVILMEECAEVIHAASKLVRFGKENRPDCGRPNTDVLSEEAGHLTCMIETAMECGLMHGPRFHNAAIDKRAKLAHFMQTEPT